MTGRNMLHGPWREAGAPTVVLHIDDPNIDSEAIAIALAYLYGQPPKLNDNNAFRVLAAASFLDLQVYFIRKLSLLPHFFAVVVNLQLVNCRIYVQYVPTLLFLSFGHQTFCNIRLVRYCCVSYLHNYSIIFSVTFFINEVI